MAVKSGRGVHFYFCSMRSVLRTTNESDQ
jgi:hypothetical protein